MLTSTVAPPRRTIRLRGVAIGALLAVGLVVLSACDVPAAPAGKLFDAWKANDPAAATGDFTTYAAKTQMFSQAYTSSAQWTFVKCDGAAGSTYCTWVNKIEGQLVLRVDNASQHVTSVQRISLGNVPSGQLFHAWRIGSQSAAAGKGHPAAITDLFAHTYHVSDHWLPEGCVTSSYVICTWTNDAGKTLVFQFDPPFNWVIGVSGTYSG